MDRDQAMRVVELAEAAEPFRAGQDAAPGAALRDAAEKIVRAIEFLIDNDRPAALRLVGALAEYWQEAGRVEEGRALTEKAIAGSHAASPEIASVRPRALLAASDLAFHLGDQEQATSRAKDCIRASIYIEDRPTASLAHSTLARVAYLNGDAAGIERHARKALELAGDDQLAKRTALEVESLRFARDLTAE